MKCCIYVLIEICLLLSKVGLEMKTTFAGGQLFPEHFYLERTFHFYFDQNFPRGWRNKKGTASLLSGSLRFFHPAVAGNFNNTKW